MQIFRSLEEIPASLGKTVVTIGNFDGVHLGHREIFRRVRKGAELEGAVSVVVTFIPHPLKVIPNKQNQIRLINTYSEKETLINLAKKEIEQIGLTKDSAVVDGYVVRQPKAYPVYDHSYKENVEAVREALKSYPGLYLVGRNGMHKYNNQDHSMMTAMLAAKNIIAGNELYDLWDVNEDAEYHEGGDRGVEETEKVLGRSVPKKLIS